MANTITSQTIVDGTKNLIVKIDILGDASGEETATVIVDASTFTPAYTDCSLVGIHATLVGFTARLYWDATANVPLFSIADYEVNLTTQEVRRFGGLPNNAGAGKTGDVLMTTAGLGAADHGTLILEFEKHQA